MTWTNLFATTVKERWKLGHLFKVDDRAHFQTVTWKGWHARIYKASTTHYILLIISRLEWWLLPRTRKSRTGMEHILLLPPFYLSCIFCEARTKDGELLLWLWWSNDSVRKKNVRPLSICLIYVTTDSSLRLIIIRFWSTRTCVCDLLIFSFFIN